MARFYPRTAQARIDARIGPDHVSRTNPRNQRSKRDSEAVGLYIQASALAGTLGNSVAATSVVAGGVPLLFTLSGGDVWAGDLISSTAKVNSLIAGLSGSGFAGIQAALNAAAFSLDTNRQKLNVVIPAVAAYSIGAAQSYNWTFLEEAFRYRAGPVTVTSCMVVKNGV
jgi:hypothetical protein